MSTIINIREHPQCLDRAVEYFTSKWGIDRKVYQDSMGSCIGSESPLPHWYLMLEGDMVIGCCGLIANDFISRQDLWPWLCGLYVEEAERGRALGARLLAHGRAEAARLGYNKVYLCTDHIGYYEKYGWRYIGDGFHPWDERSRIYEADALPPGEQEELEEQEEPVEPMDTFFDTRADSYDQHMQEVRNTGAVYRAIARCFNGLTGSPRLLDLGCGTGLELERLFHICPGLLVTCVDLSQGMLEQLVEKFPNRGITPLQGSYLELDYGEGQYDHALSTYSLHHFSEAVKLELFRKLHRALRPGGLFVEGDYTVPTLEEQRQMQREGRALCGEGGIDQGFFHYDTPFTPDTEMALLRQAGFRNVRVEAGWENASVIVAER